MAESRDLTTLILRIVARTDEMSKGINQVQGQVRGLERQTADSMAKIGKYFAGAFSLVYVLSKIRTATQDAKEFGRAMAEVSTLLPKDADMRPLIEGAKEAAKLYGSNARDEAKAYYQIISAGNTNAAKATEILHAANKLAVGGVTDTRTAADGLTSILNAYGDAAGSATDVTDAMFVAMRAGKTTIPELSQNIGQVATIAAQTGVAMDDLFAAISALTLGGVDTAQAVTQVRSALVAVLKQQPESIEMAKQLGIEWSVSSLKAKGFAQWIKEVAKATEGNAETLSALFGRVEGLSGVLALGGNAAEAYAQILDQMTRKAGETEEAFRKMTEDVGFRFDQLKATLEVVGIEFGDVLLKIILPAAVAVTEHIDLIIAGVEALAIAITTKLVVAISGKLIAAIGELMVVTTAATVATGQLSFAFMQVSTASVLLTRALAAVRAAGAAAFAFLGGWPGLLATGIGVAAAAWIYFGREGERAARKVDDGMRGLGDETDGTIDRVQRLAAEYRKLHNIETPAGLRGIEKELDDLEKKKKLLEDARGTLKEATDQAVLLGEAMVGVGVKSELTNRIDELNEKIAKLKGAILEAGRSDLGLKASEKLRRDVEQTIRVEEKRIDVIQAQIDAYKELALSGMDALLVAETGGTGADASVAFLTKELEKRKEALAKFREDAAAAEQGERDKEAAAAKEASDKKTREAAEVLRARHKAEQRIAQINMGERLATLEDEYKQGGKSLAEYYDERRDIIEKGIAREIALLQTEAKAKETKPERKEEIRAEIWEAQVAGRMEILKLTRQQEDAEKELLKIQIQAREAERVSLAREQMILLNAAYDQGKIAVEQYWEKRRALSQEILQAEVIALYEELILTKDLAKQEQILLQIQKKRQEQKAVATTETTEETVDRTLVTKESKEIGKDLTEFSRRQAITEYDIIQANYQDQMTAADDHYNRLKERIEQHKGEMIEIDGIYYEKEEALRMAADAKQAKEDEAAAERTKNMFEAKMRLTSEALGGFGEVMGALYELSGGKAKEFFEAQKAISIAQATINAYTAFTKALAELPPPFSYIQAGIALAMGLAKVALIARQKPQKMEAGGLIRDGSGVRDDVPILAMRDEYVVQKRAVRHYGAHVLEAINRMVLPREMFLRVPRLAVALPAGAYATGGLVSGGVTNEVSVGPINVESPKLASALRAGIEDTVVRILKDHHR